MPDGYVEGWDELVARVSATEDESSNLIAYINNILVPYTQQLEQTVDELLNHTHTFESGTPVIEEESESPGAYGVEPYGEGPYGES